jgi:hypothetical protein
MQGHQQDEGADPDFFGARGDRSRERRYLEGVGVLVWMMVG